MRVINLLIMLGYCLIFLINLFLSFFLRYAEDKINIQKYPVVASMTETECRIVQGLWYLDHKYFEVF